MTWDEYFYKLCRTVSKNSKCLSRQIGSVLTTKDRTVLGIGYNGPPRGVQHCGKRYLNDPELRSLMKSKDMNPDDPVYHTTCPRYVLGFKSGEGLDWCVAGHSERNALINAAREGIATKGKVLYMDCGTPCTPCLVEIINAGIEEIVITKEHYYDISAKYLAENSNLKIRIYDHLKEKGNET